VTDITTARWTHGQHSSTMCSHLYTFITVTDCIQWHQLAADRDCDLLLAATSSSAQLSRTLVPGHLPLQDPKPGISFQQTFTRLTQSTPLKVLLRHFCSADYLYRPDTSRPCNCFAMLRRVRNNRCYCCYYYYYYSLQKCLVSSHYYYTCGLRF